MAHQKHPRGICAECGTTSALRADGTPYRHYAPRRAEDEPLYCKGSERRAAFVKPAPVVRWKHEDEMRTADAVIAIGPVWINDEPVGWMPYTQAASVAQAVGLALEET